MAHLIIEIKARCADPAAVRAQLHSLGADFIGEDHQVDTYFQASSGRLKLREGNIENNLIHYHRPDQAGPKASQVSLYASQPGSTLKALLTEALGVLAVVDKRRSIFFIGNVKFHIDHLSDLGNFVEIEAIDQDGSFGRDQLDSQCRHYLDLLEIRPEDLLEQSYSDMIIQGWQS